MASLHNVRCLAGVYQVGPNPLGQWAPERASWRLVNASRRSRVIRNPLLATALLLGTLSACAAQDPGKEDAGNDAGTSDAGTPSGEIVTAVLDDAHAVTQTIGIQGGELQTRDAQGRLIKLTFPGNSLARETEIRMTPITAVSAIPLSGGVIAGVELAPKGLLLWEPATLTIELSAPLPIPSGIPFAYQEGTTAYRVQEMTAEGNTLQFRIHHFSGYGVGEGSSVDWSAISSRYQADAAEGLFQQIGVVLQNNFDGLYEPLEYSAALTNAFRDFERGPYQAFIAALGTGPTCTDDRTRVNTLFWFNREAAILGYAYENFPWAKLETTMRGCTDQIRRLCVDNHDPSFTINLLEHSKNLDIMGLVGAADHAVQAARFCGTFRVEFDSPVVTGTDYPIRTHLTSQHLWVWHDELVNPGGQAAAEPASATTGFVGASPPGCTYTLTVNPEPVLFDRVNVIYASRSGEGDDARPFERPYGDITDFAVHLAPGPSNENQLIQCPGGAPINVPLSLWTAGFYSAHESERQVMGGLVISRNFTLQDLGAELIAEKLYNLTVGDTTDTTQFRIVHAPGAVE